MSLQQTVDVTVGTAAVTSPWWMHVVEQGFSFYLYVGGGLLLTLRIMLAVRDWRRGRSDNEDK